MENLRAYRIFIIEMKELRKFRHSTKYAFANIEALLSFIKDVEHKKYLDSNGFAVKPNGLYNLDKSSILNLERTLNEQSLVRAISALEVFLIDTFRDIFLITKSPFKDQTKIHHYTQAQLLSITDTSEIFNQIINKECRNLSSGGFNEIIKSYKKNLKIDLLHLTPGKQKMIEYHEIRHLIIHKLGRTDTQFRNKYNIMNKSGISISDNYLETCLKDINSFVEKTHKLVLGKVDNFITPEIKKLTYERKAIYTINILDTT